MLTNFIPGCFFTALILPKFLLDGTPESLAKVRYFRHFTDWRAAFRPLQRTKFGRLSNKVGRFDLAQVGMARCAVRAAFSGATFGTIRTTGTIGSPCCFACVIGMMKQSRPLRDRAPPSGTLTITVTRRPRDERLFFSSFD
jgi:hypothetical protein